MSNIISEGNKYFCVIQDDGNLVIYKGTGPSDNQGFIFGTKNIASSLINVQGKVSEIITDNKQIKDDIEKIKDDTEKMISYLYSKEKNYFLALQDDSNLTIYKGSGPSDNQEFIFGTTQLLTTISTLTDKIAELENEIKELKENSADNHHDEDEEDILDYSLYDTTVGKIKEAMNFTAVDYSYFAPTRHLFILNGEYLLTSTLNGTVQVHYTHRHSGDEESAHTDSDGTYSWHMHFQGQPSAITLDNLNIDFSTEENGLTCIAKGIFFNDDFTEPIDPITKEIFLSVCSRDTTTSIKQNRILRGIIQYSDSNIYITNVEEIYKQDGVGGNAAHQIQQIVGVNINNNSHIVVSVGDSAINGAAEDPNNLNGKILVMKNDGSHPEFTGSRPYSNPFIQGIGVRNKYGLEKVSIFQDKLERFISLENGNTIDRLTFSTLFDFNDDGGGNGVDYGWRMSVGDHQTWLDSPDVNYDSDVNLAIHHSDGAPTTLKIFSGIEDIFDTNSNDEWKIENINGNNNIVHGDIIRLLHCNSDKYLIISDNPSTIIETQKEVSVQINKDENDSKVKFKLEIVSDNNNYGLSNNNNNIWCINNLIRLIHVDTNTALHYGSHYGNKKFEVTGFSYRNQGDFFRWSRWCRTSEDLYNYTGHEIPKITNNSYIKLTNVYLNKNLYSEPGDILPKTSSWNSNITTTEGQRVMLYNDAINPTIIIKPIPFRIISGIAVFYGNTGDNGSSGLWDKTIKAFTINISGTQPIIKWYPLIKRIKSGTPGWPVACEIEPRSGNIFFSDVGTGQAYLINLNKGISSGFDELQY